MNDPKIVVWDLEIIPDLNAALRVWPRIGNFPGLTLRASITSICCFGYHVLGFAGPNCINTWDYPEWRDGDVNNDKKLVKDAYEILKDADCIVTQNGIKFDLPFINSRLEKWGLPRLPPKITHVDTKRVSKSNLFLFSNSLDDIAEFLGGDRKLEHEGWPLWVKVHGGYPRKRDRAAEELMTKYCKRDVKVTAQSFKRLKKFSKLPNYNLFTIGMQNVCPNCGSTRLESRGYYRTATKSYHRYVCKDCRTWSSTDTNDQMPRVR